MKTLFSGIQPTGQIHLGNYLGALKNWVELQNKYNCYFSIVDLHAITVDYNPEEFQTRILNTAMDLIAIGVNPKKSCLFVQSHIPEHTELAWLFNTLLPIAELERMTQFKDKAAQHKKNINAGLFTYPVLQAADILLYNSEVVPVGEDQLQHLELTNKIAKKFNNKFSAQGGSASGGGPFFREVKPIVGEGARIMSLAEPTKKMSKSLGPNHYISLMDEPETIKKKISKAVTDTGDNGQMSAGVKNLFDLLKLLGNEKIYKKLLADFNNNNLQYSTLKSELSEATIKYLEPIQAKKKELAKNPNKVKKILADNAKKAGKIAEKNILEIKQKMGLV